MTLCPIAQEQDRRPCRCCGSPACTGTAEAARSPRARCPLERAEPPTPLPLQSESLSSTDPSPARNFGLVPTSGGEQLAVEIQSKERGEPARASFPYRNSAKRMFLSNIYSQ